MVLLVRKGLARRRLEKVWGGVVEEHRRLSGTALGVPLNDGEILA
jgi:hypothetical protein